MTTTLMASLLAAVLLSPYVTSQDVSPPPALGLEQSLAALGQRLRAHQALASDTALQEQLTSLGRELGGEALVSGLQQLLQASNNDSSLCYEHLALVLEGLMAKQGWAGSMLDALGKPRSGIAEGNTHWIGSYGECLDVKAGPGHPFDGQYCLAHIIPDVRKPTAALDLGGCYPSSCNHTQIAALFTELVDQILKTPFAYTTALCQSPAERQMTVAAMVVLAVLSLFGLLLVSGTVYDVCVIQRPRWRLKERENACVNGDAARAEEVRVVLDTEAKEEDQQPLVETEPRPELSIWSRLLVSFSVYTNGQKLLSTQQTAGTLTAVHGIRFLSMTWVLLGHSFSFGLQFYGNILPFITEVYDRWTYLAILNATVSVDSFFLLSGLLVAYLLTKELERARSALKVNWGLFYFHRFWRLTPPYMFVMMTYVPLFVYWGSGPSWPKDGIDPNCKDNWWTNLLYVNNLVHEDKQCMGWAWYLANDMQFYVLSPIMLIPLFMFPAVGYVITFLFLLATTIAAGVISHQYSLPPGIGLGGLQTFAGNKVLLYMSKYYFKPWCRMGPYIIGIFFGYVLQRTKCKVNLPKAVTVLGWAGAAATCLAVIYGVFPQSKGSPPMGVEVAALYNGLNRTAWALGVAWVVFACATGHGGWVNTLLSWKALVPLSRLTYCCYLVHPVVIYSFYLNQRDLISISDLNMVYLFLGNLVVTYGVALVVSLTFEAPMLALEKVIFKKR